MRGLLRSLLLLLCAEWLITFRVWCAPRVLFTFLGVAAFRFMLMEVLPYWQNGYAAYALAVVALLCRAMAFMQGARSRRTFHDTPDDGLPWLMFITRSQKVAFGLESVIVLAFVLWLANSTTNPLVYPRGLYDLPPSWASWLSHNGEYFANAHGSLTWVALLFWNMTQGAAVKRPPRRAEVAASRVREHSHSPPHLPTVKELAEEFNRDDAP